MCWLTRFLSVLALVVLVGVLPVRAETNSIDPRDVAARFLDAFYAWDAKALDTLLSHNAEGDDVRYYQGWHRVRNMRSSLGRLAMCWNQATLWL